MTLPSGQRAVEGFPRFGTHFQRPPPDVPPDPVIDISGPWSDPVILRVADLSDLPRRELVADFHCVAGWSATDLRWEGVTFETLYRTLVEPSLRPGATVTHAVFEGLDRYRSIVAIEDALADDVLVADRLDGRPLEEDHGAPVRLVSPSQYGYVNTKHLCRIELHDGEPASTYHLSRVVQRGLQLVTPHPRARVWEEERHRHLPAWAVRPFYRFLIPAIRSLSARGDGGQAG